MTTEHYIDERVREMPCPNKCDQASDHTSDPHLDCKLCHGRGVIPYRECMSRCWCGAHHHTCPHCKGTGRILMPDARPEIQVGQVDGLPGWWWRSPPGASSIWLRDTESKGAVGLDTPDKALAAARKALS